MRFSVQNIQEWVRASNISALLEQDESTLYVWDFLQHAIDSRQEGVVGAIALRLFDATPVAVFVGLKQQVENLILSRLYRLMADERITSMVAKPEFIAARLAKFEEISTAYAVGQEIPFVGMGGLVRVCVENQCLAFIFDGARADLHALFIEYLAQGLTDEVMPHLWQSQINIARFRAQLVDQRGPHIESRAYHEVLAFFVKQLQDAEASPAVPVLAVAWLNSCEFTSYSVKLATVLPALLKPVRECATIDSTKRTALYRRLKFGASGRGFDSFLQGVIANPENDPIVLSFLLQVRRDEVLKDSLQRTRCGFLLHLLEWANGLREQKKGAKKGFASARTRQVKGEVREELEGMLGQMMHYTQGCQQLRDQLIELRQYVSDLRENKDRWGRATRGSDSKLERVLVSIEEAFEGASYTEFLKDLRSSVLAGDVPEFGTNVSALHAGETAAAVGRGGVEDAVDEGSPDSSSADQRSLTSVLHRSAAAAAASVAEEDYDPLRGDPSL